MLSMGLEPGQRKEMSSGLTTRLAMLEASSQTPDYLTSPTTPPAAPSPPPAPTPTKPKQFLSLVSDRPSLRVTSEFDSDSRVFFHKVSCKLFDDLAKLKLSFVNNVKREISKPLLVLKSKHLSIHYDPEEQNALIKTSFDVGPKLHFKAAHDVKVYPFFCSVVLDV
ncbi:hypothetical protein GQ457_06G022520 [Hibiscus cannabinus]